MPPEAPVPAHTLGQVQLGRPCCRPETLIEVRELTVAYGPRTVLSGVSLDIPRGCITALIGPSGCGKTSFLGTLNRMSDLSPGARVSGRLRFDGLDLLDPALDLMALRRRIGMVFQRPNPFPLSIRRNLDLPLREHGVANRGEREARIETALRDVGLWDEVAGRLDAPALGLSGGQQQRLCVARALVLRPEVLLMDEPCSALDPLASAVVEDLIVRLRGRYTVVIVTHNLAQARRIANYTAFFWLQGQIGQLVEQGSHLFDAPEHALTAAYLSGARG